MGVFLCLRVFSCWSQQWSSGIVFRISWKKMSTPLERYQKLGLRDSLPRIYQYPFVCKELSFILRGAYNKLPKNLQSLVFQDTLAAFRLLPQYVSNFPIFLFWYCLLGEFQSIPGSCFWVLWCRKFFIFQYPVIDFVFKLFVVWVLIPSLWLRILRWSQIVDSKLVLIFHVSYCSVHSSKHFLFIYFIYFIFILFWIVVLWVL